MESERTRGRQKAMASLPKQGSKLLVFAGKINKDINMPTDFFNWPACFNKLHTYATHDDNLSDLQRLTSS